MIQFKHVYQRVKCYLKVIPDGQNRLIDVHHFLPVISCLCELHPEGSRSSLLLD